MKFSERAKRALIYFGITATLLIIGLYAYGSKVQDKFPDYSTYNSSDKGTKALFLLTGQMNYNVLRFERPSRFLLQGRTLVVIKPDLKVFYMDREINYLREWLEKGNSAIVADEAVTPEELNSYGFSLKAVAGGSEKGFSTEYRAGEGRIYFINNSDVLTNKGLRESETAVRFIRLLDDIGQKGVMFNEYYHGAGARGITIRDLLGQKGLLVLIQILLAVTVLLYVRSRRLGRPVVVFEIVKRQENENIFALSGIYFKAKAHAIVLQTYIGFFKKQLSKYLGFGSVPHDEELLKVASGYRHLENAKLAQCLGKCNSFIREKRKDGKELLTLIRNLEKIRKEMVK